MNLEDTSELPHIKEEKEEFLTTSEGAQLLVHVIPVVVKNEDEEKPQSSQFLGGQTDDNSDAECLKTGAVGEDCAGSQPSRDFNPDSDSQAATRDKSPHSSETETDNGWDWNYSESQSDTESDDDDLVRPVPDLGDEVADCLAQDSAIKNEDGYDYTPAPSTSVAAQPQSVKKEDEADDEDEDGDEERSPRQSTTSGHPMKRPRNGSLTFSKRVKEDEEEEDRWHNKEEKDRKPDPLRFMPAREPGLTIDPTAFWSPLILFQLFFSAPMVHTIVANTNANAAKILQSGIKFAWTPLTVSDFYVFLAVIIFSGLVKVHNRADYWKRQWPYNFQFPFDTMKQNRFETILLSLHLCNPSEDEENERKRNTPGYDSLFKIKPLYTELVNACRLHFHPYRNIIADQRMMITKAHISLRQYLKEKPMKGGYKIFVLADSRTGYTWNFFVHDGNSKDSSGKGLGYSSVMDLMEFPVLGRGYTLFVDSFYSSPALFEELARQKTGACGIIKKNRIGYLKTKQNDLPKYAESGDMRWIRKNKLLFVKWMDTREVTFCSTVHEAFSGQAVPRPVKEAGAWKTRNVTIPDPVLEYNRTVDCADLSDNLIDCQSVHQKTMKWYKTLFYHFMDIAVVNSFLLYMELFKKNCLVTKKPLSQKCFREKLAAEMLEFAKASAPTPAPAPAPAPVPAPAPPQTKASCMPAFFGDLSNQTRRFCRRCQDAGIKRVKTPVYCAKCQVPLCLTAKRNCFKDWHKD